MLRKEGGGRKEGEEGSRGGGRQREREKEKMYTARNTHTQIRRCRERGGGRERGGRGREGGREGGRKREEEGDTCR